MKIISLFLSFLFITNVEAKTTNLEEYIPDENLRSCIMSQYNMESPVKKEIISLDDLTEIKNLNCSSYLIANTKGIEKLTNLRELNLSNNNISSINLEKNLELNSLEMKNNLLKKINVGKNINLSTLDLSDNQIEEIFLANNILLKKLDLSNNYLTTLDIKGNLNLRELSIKGNSFSYSIEKKNESFKPTILYNPYFQENLENITYTSSDDGVAGVNSSGKISPISSGNVVFTKSYRIQSESGKEEVKEVNYLKVEEKKLQIKREDKMRNIPYIFLFGIVLLLLGIFILKRYLNLEKKK